MNGVIVRSSENATQNMSERVCDGKNSRIKWKRENGVESEAYFWLPQTHNYIHRSHIFRRLNQ